MILNDKWIREQVEKNDLIQNFVPQLVSKIDTPKSKTLSFGLSSYGYDLRLSGLDFRLFKSNPDMIIDPKRFNPDCLETLKCNYENSELFFILPPYSYGLGVSIERVNMPRNVTGICVGKSTYARCGIVTPLTPIEAGFRGFITLEIANHTGIPAKVYANEGLCQLLFFQGEECETSYADRNGKYQDQESKVVLAKV